MKFSDFIFLVGAIGGSLIFYYIGPEHAQMFILVLILAKVTDERRKE